MTEREKMIAGELYDALDPELVAMRARARELSAALSFRELFASGGDTVTIQPPFFTDYGANTHLGRNVFFNFNCVVLDVCPVHIGDYTMFGPGVQILTPLHPMNAQERRSREYGAPITIGDDVWVGGGALILPGVRVGSRSVIGAGSVVTRDVPEDTFVAGNPARVIRRIE